MTTTMTIDAFDSSGSEAICCNCFCCEQGAADDLRRKGWTLWNDDHAPRMDQPLIWNNVCPFCNGCDKKTITEQLRRRLGRGRLRQFRNTENNRQRLMCFVLDRWHDEAGKCLQRPHFSTQLLSALDSDTIESLDVPGAR